MWVIDKSSCSTLTYLQSTILGCWMKIRKNVHILLILVRFLVLVTTMVTKVDHNSAFPSFSYYDGNQGWSW